jgi:hypothetical protein
MPFRSFKKKESNDAGAKAPDRKKPNQRKRAGGGGAASDDDSIDSRGNVRGFIAYSDDDSHLSSGDESATSRDSSSSEGAVVVTKSRGLKPRKAALKARKRIQRKLKKDETRSSSSSYHPKDKEPSRKKTAAAASETEEDTSESEVETEDEKARRHRRRRALAFESDTDDETEDEDEDEESEEEDETEEEDDYDDAGGPAGLIISIGGDNEVDERMIPRRHNMKKETAEVKKFVKLVTEPQEDGGIDDQIDEFKRLAPEKRTELLAALERKPAAGTTQQSMMFRILTMKLSPEAQSMVLSKYNALQAMDPGSGEYFKQRAWLEKLTSLPLGIYRDIPVRLTDGTEACGAFMERARKCLAEAIYGQEEAKIQILQFIASKIANPSARGLSLLLAGPPGIGKTSLIKNGIAKALAWPFEFISLGGDSDATTYVGHQMVYEGSHCGKIANSLVAAKSMSMVLMFDELDKISATAKGEEVQNLLVHLTDPVQNGDFEDKYLSGIPLDLSKILFTFSANDLGKIDRVLMDRMVVIQLQGYSEKEKLSIAENFLLPAALREVNLEEKVAVGREVLEHILREYANEEQGVRELKRCVEAVVQKVNMLRIFNTKDLPFHIPDFQLPFVLKKQHVDLFLKKKKPAMDVSVQRMYV